MAGSKLGAVTGTVRRSARRAVEYRPIVDGQRRAAPDGEDLANAASDRDGAPSRRPACPGRHRHGMLRSSAFDGREGAVRSPCLVAMAAGPVAAAEDERAV